MVNGDATVDTYKSDAGDGVGSGDENDGRGSFASPESGVCHMPYPYYQVPSLRDTNIKAQRDECWAALSPVQTSGATL